MSDPIDLKELEKKAWKSTFDDGVFEIYFGILHFSLTLGVILDNILSESLSTIITLSFIGLGFIFFLIAKKYISQPRIGKVKFAKPRIMRKVKIIGILTINFFILLILFLVGNLNPQFKLIFPGYLYGLIVGLLFFTLPLCFVAYFLQFNRLYVIAILTGISFFLDEIFALLMVPEPFDSLLAFGMISTIILSIGIVVFIRFLKKYPKEEIL
jgi:energy-converting hydrogenase Eha subunit C